MSEDYPFSLTLYLKPSVECLVLCVHGGQTGSHCGVGGRTGLVRETSMGPAPLLSLEHLPAMTTGPEGGGGGRELLLPRALQNNLHFLECRKPVFVL